MLPSITVTNLTITGEAVATGLLGFLGVDMPKATLTMDPGVTLKFTFGDPGAAPDGLIRADELLNPANPDALVDFIAATDDLGDPEDYVGILNTNSRSKLDEIRKAITEEYGDKPVPATMLDAIANAWNTFTPPSGLKGDIENAIHDDYQDETAVLGSSTDTAFMALINNGGANAERFNYRKMEGLVVNTLSGDDYVVLDDVIAATSINLGLGEDKAQIGQGPAQK